MLALYVVVNSKVVGLAPVAYHMIVRYNTSAVKIYNATTSLGKEF
jgi:hypothetical protein